MLLSVDLIPIPFGHLETKVNTAGEFYFSIFDIIARYTSLLPADLPQIYVWSKSEDSIPFSYIETEPYATGE